MADRPAVNASPLIFLTRAGLLDLLRLAAPELVVPAPVADEIRRLGRGDPAARALDAVTWLEVVEPPPVPAAIQAWDLGPGESSVLAWCAARPGLTAILDDLSGRRCAEALGIPVRGTVGLVLMGATAPPFRCSPGARVSAKRGNVPLGSRHESGVANG